MGLLFKDYNPNDLFSSRLTRSEDKDSRGLTSSGALLSEVYNIPSNKKRNSFVRRLSLKHVAYTFPNNSSLRKKAFCFEFLERQAEFVSVGVLKSATFNKLNLLLTIVSSLTITIDINTGSVTASWLSKRFWRENSQFYIFLD